MSDNPVLDAEFKVKTLARADMQAHESGGDTRAADNALYNELQTLNRDPAFAKQVITSLHGDTSGGYLPELSLDDHQVGATEQHALYLKMNDNKASIFANSGVETDSNHGITTTAGSIGFGASSHHAESNEARAKSEK